MPVDTSDDSARRKLLWDLSAERRNQGRHSENLRSSVAGYVMTAASALVAVITYDKQINIYDLPLAIIVVLIGIIGALFSSAYTERYHRNRRRASDLLKELDRMTVHFGRSSVTEIEAGADATTWSKKRFSIVRKISSSHWLWLAFPILVAILGIVLMVVAIECGHCIPAR